jgi:hypothetical protein
MRVRFSKNLSPFNIKKKSLFVRPLFHSLHTEDNPLVKNIKNSPFLILPLKAMCDNQTSAGKDWEKGKAEGEVLRRTGWTALTEIKETRKAIAFRC